MFVRLSIAGAIGATYLLMVMGNLVTTTGSGLACPDWPLCYGSVMPPFEYQIWFEWGHRLLGGVAGLAILASTVLVWMNRQGTERYLTGVALALLGVGVLFGGVIVRTESPLLEGPLHLFIISFHIILSTLIFSLMIMAFRKTGGLVDRTGRGRIYAVIFSLTLAQVFLGIVVRYGEATLACSAFPMCNPGEWLPNFSEFNPTIHFIHRLIAYAITGVVTWYLVKSFQEGIDKTGAVVTFCLVIVQVSFGIGLVQTLALLPLIVLHGATAFGLLGWLAYQAAPGFLIPTNRSRKKGSSLHPAAGALA
jgi:cytochrome c oxidase assembly protein subunit 15